MKFIKHTPTALFVGVQACVIQMIDQLIHGLVPLQGNIGFSWISFYAWATYFMLGCTIYDGFRAVISFAIGIVSGIVIFALGGAFGALGFFGTPLAVLLIAWLLFYMEKLPKLVQLIPPVYVSCATFFGVMMYVPGATNGAAALTIGIYLLLGLFFGWMTIAFRTWYDKRTQKSAPAES